MSEAPKKIWVSDMGGWFEQEGCGSDIPYIRADIVDELVEALKNLCTEAEHDIKAKYAGLTHYPCMKTDMELDLTLVRNAEAALAKLEESHE